MTEERIEELALKANIGIYPLTFTIEKEKYFRGDHINMRYRFASNIIQKIENTEKSLIRGGKS